MQNKKSWTSQEDQVLNKIVESIQNQILDYQIDWKLVSQRFKSQLEVYKTPKQCNDRWNHHLKPGSTKDLEWTYQQHVQLFELQEDLGNKWTIIASRMKKRKDSAYKNYFYATLRKSIRIINNFICQHRNQEFYKNFKTFPQNCIAKIVAQDQNKKSKKIRVTKDNIPQAARQIKSLLLEISREYSSRDLIQDSIFKISEFNRNCRRLRTKKRKAYQLQFEQNFSTKKVRGIKLSQQNFQEKEEEELISVLKDSQGSIEIQSQDEQAGQSLNINVQFQRMIFKEKTHCIDGNMCDQQKSTKHSTNYYYECDQNLLLSHYEGRKFSRISKMDSIQTKFQDYSEGFMLPNPLLKIQENEKKYQSMGVIQRICKCPNIYVCSEMEMSIDQQLQGWISFGNDCVDE